MFLERIVSYVFHHSNYHQFACGVLRFYSSNGLFSSPKEIALSTVLTVVPVIRTLTFWKLNKCLLERGWLGNKGEKIKKYEVNLVIFIMASINHELSQYSYKNNIRGNCAGMPVRRPLKHCSLPIYTFMYDEKFFS